MHARVVGLKPTLIRLSIIPIGLVTSNEGNARFFEPGLSRSWTLGMGAAYRI